MGNLSSIAIERCSLAAEIFKKNPEYYVLPTGGFGEHFNIALEPHAHYTSRFLLAKGVPQPRILEAALSRSTLEDATLSQRIVEKYDVRDIIVVTSDFHLERVKLIFAPVFAKYKISFLGSHTELPEAQLKALFTHEETAILQMNP